MTACAHARTCMDLHPGARIGTHFFVDHCTGTVVGETAVIPPDLAVEESMRLGISGDIGDNDEICAVAGIEAAGLTALPGAPQA